MTTLDFLNMYDTKEGLDSEQLRLLWWDDLFEDGDNIKEIGDTEYGEQDRWTHLETRIICINDRYFQLARWAGNTEYQENEYDIQPEEVKPVEKTITVWEVVNGTV